MKKIFSLSKYPGGAGIRYYNYYFKKYNLDYSYEVLPCDKLTDELIEFLITNSHGFNVSSPFKTDILKYITVNDNVSDFDLCNTVINENGNLLGCNTDYYGVLEWVSKINKNDKVLIISNGSMGKMFSKMLSDDNIYTTIKHHDVNYDDEYDIIVNCSLYGTIDSKSPFNIIPKCKTVYDLAIKDNELKKQCQVNNINYVGGIEFYKIQFRKQFKLYTGIEIDKIENLF